MRMIWPSVGLANSCIVQSSAILSLQCCADFKMTLSKCKVCRINKERGEWMSRSKKSSVPPSPICRSASTAEKQNKTTS